MGCPPIEQRAITSTTHESQLMLDTAVVSWEPIDLASDDQHIRELATAMRPGDAYLWDGPPLVADIAGEQLYTGSHRQAALRGLLAAHGSGGSWIPVVDIWTLINQAETFSRSQRGETWWDVIVEQVDRLESQLRTDLGLILTR